MKSLKVILVLAILISSFGNLSANTGWNKVYIPIKANIGNLEFLNANFGVVTTDKNDILVTYDGGNTFVNKTNCLFGTTYRISKIIIKCENEIYLLHYGSLYLSNDKCCTWQKVKIDPKNDSLNIWDFAIYDNKYLCMSSNGVFSYNLCKWENIISYRDLLNGSSSISDFKFLSENTFIVCNSKRQILCGGSHSYYYYDNLYTINTNNKVVLLNTTNISNYSNYIYNITQIDNKLYATISDDFMISSDYGNNWENYFKDSDFKMEFDCLSKINENTFFLTNNFDDAGIKKIFRVKGNEIKSCKLDTCGNYYINFIKSINNDIAFARLNTCYRYYDMPSDITNYFLKTTDGGGVSATSVESDEVKSSIKDSYELHLIDMLGKEIRNYDNYYKFEMDKPNLAPPFLIKWKDSKGVYHFQKL